MKSILIITTVLLIAGLSYACSSKKTNIMNQSKINEAKKQIDMTGKDTASFAAGCFWCVEAVFQRLEGVDTVISGFTGGTVKNPAYREVCNGTTGHAEVCQIIFDPAKISYLELLQVFFKVHDPTQLNRQGNDTGTQYRSAIFYHNNEQKKLAEEVKAELDKSGAWDAPIVTEISKFTVFYPADDYHHNYFNQNGSQSYCQYVIQPKVEKFEKVFKDKIKKSYLAH
jgi:peptide-methionine (S)-S-oxide reductase